MPLFVIDSHCDTPSHLWDYGETLENTTAQVSLPFLQAYAGAVQFFASFTNPYEADPAQYCWDVLRGFCAQLQAYPDVISLVTSYEQLSERLQEGKIAAILTVEGGQVIGEDLTLLSALYCAGVRAMTLTWNFDNAIGGGVLGSFCSREEAERRFRTGKGLGSRGLTPFGREVVREMNRLGMMVDVSHGSPALVEEVAACSSRPFLASHSNAMAVCPHPRNLTDAQFLKLVECGGMVGVSFVPSFLSKKDSATINDVIRHIEHFLSLGGENCIGLGSDFDGMDQTPSDLLNSGDLGQLYDALLKRNYSETLVKKIFFDNYHTFLKNNF